VSWPKKIQEAGRAAHAAEMNFVAARQKVHEARKAFRQAEDMECQLYFLKEKLHSRFADLCNKERRMKERKRK
jgi:hypothetical protein